MRRGLTILVILAVVAGAAAAGWTAASRIKSPAQIAAETEPPPPSLITVPVEEIVIANDVVTRGTVRFDQPESVSASEVALDGVTAVLTEMPHVGDEFVEGDVLYEIAGRPAFVLQGDLPLFRTVTIGDEGEDVLQLQTALNRLGFEIDQLDGVYGYETEHAVKAFYEEHGYEPIQPTDEAKEAYRTAKEAYKLAKDKVTREKLAKAKAALAAPAPETEFLFFPTFPIRVDSVLKERGDVADGEIMQVSGSRLAIDSSVKVAEAEYVEVGAPVTIELDRLGVSMEGEVSFVADAPGTNEVAPDRVYVEIIPGEVREDLNNTNVKITIPVASRSTSGPVLAVPAAALSATGSGDTIVTVQDGDDATHTVTVLPGLSTAGGMVEVTPLDGDLEAGDRVVVGLQSGS